MTDWRDPGGWVSDKARVCAVLGLPPGTPTDVVCEEIARLKTLASSSTVTVRDEDGGLLFVLDAQTGEPLPDPPPYVPRPPNPDVPSSLRRPPR